MKAYQICLLILYFCNFRKTLSTNEQQPTSTVVEYDLRKLRQNLHTSKDKSSDNRAKYVFNPESHTGLKKVFYYKTDLWTPGSGEKLKQLEAWERYNVLQLVHLKVLKNDREEDLYYRKNKDKFVKLNDKTDYDNNYKTLHSAKTVFLDEWHPVDFRKKEDYSPFFEESVTMVDGVWKKTLTRVWGSPYILKDGEEEVWNHTDEGELYSLEDYDFGDNKYLLVLNFKPPKFYSKNGSESWTKLQDQATFLTKFKEFKSKFFENQLEYDVSEPPDLQKFATQRMLYEGNVSLLTLFPVRNYYLSKLKYKETAFWTSDKDKRAPTVHMLLLGYEVKLVSVLQRLESEPHEPKYKVRYFYKESNGFIEKEKSEYRKLKTAVESSGDKTRPFTYNSNWLQTAARLDLAQYNPSEFEVESTEDKLVVKYTLKPKGSNVFNQVGLGSLQLWPSERFPATDALVKEVKYVTKDSTFQLFHVKGTKSSVRGENTSGTVEVDLFLKKDGDEFFSLTSDQYNQFLNLLQEKDYFVSKEYDLDVTNEDLNPVFFKVVKEFLDGVESRVVTPTNTKVTRVHSLDHDLWRQEHGLKDKYLDHYQLFVLGDTMLLKLLFRTALSNTYNWQYYEKSKNLQWSQLDATPFNTKLNSLKNVSEWNSLELDVSTRPLPTDYKVVVNRLLGSRTELVLTPVWGKKLVKVKLGETDVWNPGNNKRVERVHLYLEGYEAKFLMLEVLTPQESGNPLKTQEKLMKVDSTFSTPSDFESQLTQFKLHDNNVVFTYNDNWELPPDVFDPKSYLARFFDVTKTADTFVTTVKYTPKSEVVVKKASYDGVKVWPETEEKSTTKKLVFLEVFLKHDMVQLLHVKNALLENQSSPEDLYFKKAKETYTKVDENEFNKLKGELNQEDSYVDDNVKLDLSAEVSSELFAKEKTVEDGVEKEVVELKHGKLYEVKASPPLWTSQDGSYVKKLERYELGDSQLLVLYVTKTDNTVEKLYFQKPTVVEPPVSPESRETTGATTGDTQGQQPQDGASQEPQREQASGEEPPSAPPKPSFAPLATKGEFFEKLNEKKATVQYTNVELNLTSYNDTSKFKVVESSSENYRVFKLYPLPGKRVTRLMHGTEEHWKPEKEGERLVEAWVYLHDEKVKFVKGLVWDKDHTDESTDQVAYLQMNLETNKYEVKDEKTFNEEFQKVLSVKPEPLPLSTGVVLPTKTRVLKKLFLRENLDSRLFTVNNQTSDGKTVKTFTPKNEVFVNLVETSNSVLWKAYQKDDLWKSATFTTKGDLGHAELTVTENSVDEKKYFKLENYNWTKVNLQEFNKLKELTGSAESPAQPTPSPEPAVPSGSGGGQQSNNSGQPAGGQDAGQPTGDQGAGGSGGAGRSGGAGAPDAAPSPSS